MRINFVCEHGLSVMNVSMQKELPAMAYYNSNTVRSYIALVRIA